MVRVADGADGPLTGAEFQVLVSLADSEKHGYAIGKEVARRTDGRVTLRAATLYTVIKRLLLPAVGAWSQGCRGRSGADRGDPEAGPREAEAPARLRRDSRDIAPRNHVCTRSFLSRHAAPVAGGVSR